ncbi:O-antigen ligase family protein [Geobacter luticola]|uniref:O-antigen ligase family protein n=1 Tax=Geomobilimonas luticola TaxID=1114878 RepID=A0ABS5SFR9_9BACT|nr:O-antigen ligase family protein [Geomobilimonas luticola]
MSFIKFTTVVSLVLLLVLFPLQILLGGRLCRTNRWFALSVLQYLFIIALSLAYTHDMDFGYRAIRFCSIALVALILVEKLPSRPMAQRILHAFIAGGTVLSLIISYEGMVKHIVRPSHVWMGVHAGNLLLFSLVATVSLLLEADSRRKIAYAGAMTVQLFAFYLNGTRGAWIAFALILACIPFLVLKLRTLWKVAYIAAVVLAMSLVTRGTYFQTKLHEAVTDVRQYGEGVSDTSLGGRFEMWKASSRMFMEHPLIGVGAGDWVDEFQKITRQSKASAFLMQFNQPHSIYLEALSTRGLVGMASLLLFIGYPAIYVWRRKGRETAVFRSVVLFSTLAMLISGLTDTLTNVRFVFMAYCILIGVGMSAFTSADRNNLHCRKTERYDETG